MLAFLKAVKSYDVEISIVHRAKHIDIYLSHVLHEVLLHVLACWKGAEFLKTY